MPNGPGENVRRVHGEVMRLVAEVRHSALSLRMVPIGTTLRRFERVVRDVCMGTLRLNSYHEAENIVVEVTDDGRGLDRERILAKGGGTGIGRARYCADRLRGSIEVETARGIGYHGAYPGSLTLATSR
jgi:chemotaxis protein histidine kinase CheA